MPGPARNEGMASAASGHEDLHRFHHLVGGDAEEFEHFRRRAAFAEAVDADHRPIEADVLAPPVGDAGFNGEARNAARQHGVAVGSLLLLEDEVRGQRHDADADACGGETPAGKWRLLWLQPSRRRR